MNHFQVRTGGRGSKNPKSLQMSFMVGALGILWQSDSYSRSDTSGMNTKNLYVMSRDTSPQKREPAAVTERSRPPKGNVLFPGHLY